LGADSISNWNSAGPIQLGSDADDFIEAAGGRAYMQRAWNYTDLTEFPEGYNIVYAARPEWYETVPLGCVGRGQMI
jgi:hypothetical protein